MFGKFSEQVKKSSQPVNSLVALNAKRLEALSQMQTEFFTGFMADSLKYVESMSVQTEVKGVIAAQTSYAEALKDRFAHASKDTYGAMNNIREEYTDLLKTSLNESVANVPAATHATATAAAPIKPVVPADKPAVQAAPKKAEVKPVAKPAAKAKPAVKAASKPAATPAATIVSSTPANAEAKKL